ncbi:hypothetical protein KIN20_035831 [Parelaphostrongylus tenuis]|uniref:Uncharacterized protein n=1 Tax=Parelaphostrongylus tenuis TaxID=148309 RepID=A0AAD5RC18_PARTN|nr:hypothetical protein KIN20_035831 [Parelaphostrongylus tenuis]
MLMWRSTISAPPSGNRHSDHESDDVDELKRTIVASPVIKKFFGQTCGYYTARRMTNARLCHSIIYGGRSLHSQNSESSTICKRQE